MLFHEILFLLVLHCCVNSFIFYTFLDFDLILLTLPSSFFWFDIVACFKRDRSCSFVSARDNLVASPNIPKFSLNLTDALPTYSTLARSGKWQSAYTPYDKFTQRCLRCS